MANTGTHHSICLEKVNSLRHSVRSVLSSYSCTLHQWRKWGLRVGGDGLWSRREAEDKGAEKSS
jgi:hypothetical protein